MDWWQILLIILVIASAALAGLYFWGRKLQKKQADAEVQIEAMKQTASMLIIDKKLLKPAQSGLPEAAISQFPWYVKRQKLPIIKAKVGAKIVVLMADRSVWDIIPVKKECKVVISGIYITELKSVRGMAKLPEPPAKVGFFKRMINKVKPAK